MNKKRKIVDFFIMISGLLSCATPGSKHEQSQWAELERAGEIACGVWPVQESELDVASISGTSGGKGGFVATMRLRNGSQLPVYAETNGNETVGMKQLQPFPVGRDAHVIAVSVWKKEPVAFVIQNKNDRAWLEIRAIRDNRMLSRMATPFSEEALSGKIISADKGWWLQVNHSETVSSFVYISPENAANWKFVASSFQSSSRFSTITGSGSKPYAYAIERAKGNDANKSQFVVTKLEASGKFAEVGTFPIETKGGVETWSAVSLGERILFAVVRGDSMIGQGVLTIVAAEPKDGEVSEAWHKDFPFPDVHLGDPAWLTNGTTAMIGLMRWIDADGSLSRIKIDRNGAELLRDAGVFPKGTVLVTGFLDEKDKGLGAFRYRDNELWKYKLCKISLK
jgi:hypothetical protein